MCIVQKNLSEAALTQILEFCWRRLPQNLQPPSLIVIDFWVFTEIQARNELQHSPSANMPSSILLKHHYRLDYSATESLQVRSFSTSKLLSCTQSKNIAIKMPRHSLKC